ncbi:hypothetical protein [Ligilactobacillus salivarius]|nr:hypothetical protein [Ligilactobacillus salivarius]
MAKKVIQKQKDNRARVWSFIVYPEKNNFFCFSSRSIFSLNYL